jgi:hypothetical protein
MDQILAVQGSEQLQIYRGKHGYIHSMIVAYTDGSGNFGLGKLYAPGKHLGGIERPYDNLSKDWQPSDANEGVFITGPDGVKAKDAAKHTAMTEGKFSGTKITVTITPASWIPVPAPGGKVFSDTMHDYYKKGGDNYYAGIQGNKVSLYYAFGTDYLKAGATTFTPVNSKGDDLSKKKPGESVGTKGFRGQDYAAIYFNCTGGKSGSPTPDRVAELKQTGKIVVQS